MIKIKPKLTTYRWNDWNSKKNKVTRKIFLSSSFSSHKTWSVARKIGEHKLLTFTRAGNHFFFSLNVSMSNHVLLFLLPHFWLCSFIFIRWTWKRKTQKMAVVKRKVCSTLINTWTGELGWLCCIDLTFIVTSALQC